MYINSGQYRCMNCLDSDLIKILRRRYVRAVEFRMNGNAISDRMKNQLIVGSPILAQYKLDFVAKKIETISISQSNWQDNIIKMNVMKMMDCLFC